MERIVLLMEKELKDRLVEEAKTDRRSISNYIITHFIEKEDSAPASHKISSSEGGEVKVVEKEVIVEKVVEVDKTVSKLPQPVIDFYRERALDKDGDLCNCLADNLIDRAIVSGVALDENSSAHEGEKMRGGIVLSKETLESMKKANKKLAEMQGRNIDNNEEEVKKFKEKYGL